MNFSAFAQEFFAQFDLAAELLTKRTVQDLDVLTRLCFREPDPHCPLAKKPLVRTAALGTASDVGVAATPTGQASSSSSSSSSFSTTDNGALVQKRQRRDAFVHNRPYLFGRVPATEAGGYCETCFAVVDEVRADWRICGLFFATNRDR